MTNEFTKELMAITQYAITSDTVNTENTVKEMLKDLLKHFEQTTENEKREEEIREELQEAYLLLFKDRKKLVKIFKKWCEDNNADMYSQEAVIEWMQIKGFIDTKNVKEFLEDIEDE